MAENFSNIDKKVLEDLFTESLIKYFKLRPDERAITVKKEIDFNDINLNKKFKMENNLSTFIKTYGFTQSEVAEKIGISSRTLSNIATNKFNTSLDVALKLSALFHVSVNEIFSLSKEEIEK